MGRTKSITVAHTTGSIEVDALTFQRNGADIGASLKDFDITVQSHGLGGANTTDVDARPPGGDYGAIAATVAPKVQTSIAGKPVEAVKITLNGADATAGKATLTATRRGL